MHVPVSDNNHDEGVVTLELKTSAEARCFTLNFPQDRRSSAVRKLQELHIRRSCEPIVIVGFTRDIAVLYIWSGLYDGQVQQAVQVVRDEVFYYIILVAYVAQRQQKHDLYTNGEFYSLP